MAKRRVEIIIFFIILCMCFSPLMASAKSTSDATEPIDTERECSLEISCHLEEIAFSDVSVSLYKIADVSSDFEYSILSAFAPCGLSVNGIKTNDEWNVVKTTLESYIMAENMEADVSVLSNKEGKAVFEKLSVGLYLAIFGKAEAENTKCSFDSALIALPNLDSNNSWDYRPKVNPKGVIVSEGEVIHKVLKLWKDHERGDKRPVEITVEIFKDGVSYETVVLSKKNFWSYSWSAKDDGSRWTVVERDIPKGYYVTVLKRDTIFVLTNTLDTDGLHSEEPPSTGDTSNVMFFVVIMILSGFMLIFIGLIGKKRSE